MSDTTSSASETGTENTAPVIAEGDFDLQRTVFIGYDSDFNADIERDAVASGTSDADVERACSVVQVVDADISRSPIVITEADAPIIRRAKAVVEYDADIQRTARVVTNGRVDPSVKVTVDLSKSIQDNLPRMATTDYVQEQIKKFISDSKELQTVLENLQESLGADDVDRVVKALGKYLPLEGGTISGDLEVHGKLHGTADTALKAVFTERSNYAVRSGKAEMATTATTAQMCLGNATSADNALYATRAGEADSCVGNAATATLAEQAKSVMSVPWSVVTDAPTQYPANGGHADSADTAESVDWKNVKNHPEFMTNVKWTDIQGIPPTAEATTIAWENVTGKPAAMPASGGTADVAKSVEWSDIKNKPVDKVVTWDMVQEKPSVYLKADKIDWNLDVINKPKYYPAMSIAWEQITGKPDLFPNQPIDYGDLLNVPKTFTTTWDLIQGKPTDLVHKTDKIANAVHADEAAVAFSVPTKDVGGNIWISE